MIDKETEIESTIKDLHISGKISRWYVLRNYSCLIDFINSNKKYEYLKTELSLQYDMAKESL